MDRSVVVLAVLLVSAAGAVESAKDRAHQLFKDGEAAYQAGHYPEAIEKYSQAFALVPLPLLLFDLGQAYRLNGDLEQAAESYRKYLDVDSNGRAAGEAREHLVELGREQQRREDARRAEEDARHAKAERAAAEAAEARAAKSRAAQEARDAEAARHAEGQRRADEQPAALTSPATPSVAKKPVWKKAWFWASLGVAAVAIAAGAGLGAAYGTVEHDPVPSFGRVPAK